MTNDPTQRCNGCSKDYPTHLMFRCYFCRLSFCDDCGRGHFGKDIHDGDEWREKARQQSLRAGRAEAALDRAINALGRTKEEVIEAFRRAEARVI